MFVKFIIRYPDERRHFCLRCRKHKMHKCSIYKKGRDSMFRQGRRRYDQKQQGWGGQTKPIFHKKAKVTKKNVIRLVCKDCKCTSFKVLKRCHILEIVRAKVKQE